MEAGGRRRGLSLTEAIIAIFVMIAAFMVIASLFHSGLRYAWGVEARNLGVMLAERKLEEIRAYSQSFLGASYGFDDLSSFVGTSTDADFPAYQLTVDLQDVPLYSASSEFERLMGTDQKVLTGSARQIRVTANWGTGQVKLVSILADPTRSFNTTMPSAVVVQPTSAVPPVLSKDASILFRAYGYDEQNRVIPDLMFKWYIMPGTANATMSSDRMGKVATLTNVIYIPSQPPLYTPGQITVVARAQYRGDVVEGTYGPIDLEGP